MSKAISRRDFMKVTGAVGAAGLLAACGGNSAASSSAASTASSAPAASADESLALSDGPVSMTISWWGGDSRHEAYQNAIKEFQAEHTNITIEPTFAAWSGWEEKMAAAFIAGNFMKPLIRYRPFYSGIPVLLKKAGKSTCSAVF